MASRKAMETLIIALVAIACASYTGKVASEKGYESGPWTAGGLLLGPLALLACLGLPDLKLRKYMQLIAEHQGALDKNALHAMHTRPGKGEVFQPLEAPPESIWAEIVNNLPFDAREKADPEISEYRKGRITIKDREGKVLAVFVVDRTVRDGILWRPEKRF